MIFSFNTYAGIDSVNEIVDTAVTVETGQMNVSSVVRDTADEQDNVVGRPSRPVNVVGEAPLVSLADPVVLDVDVGKVPMLVGEVMKEAVPLVDPVRTDVAIHEHVKLARDGRPEH
jgi:hypothetical protein